MIEVALLFCFIAILSAVVRAWCGSKSLVRIANPTDVAHVLVRAASRLV